MVIWYYGYTVLGRRLFSKQCHTVFYVAKLIYTWFDGDDDPAEVSHCMVKGGVDGFYDVIKAVHF